MNATCIRRPSATWTTCRCDTCQPQRLHMAKLARNGRTPRRRSDEAWVEVDRLLAHGWTPAAIADAAGLPERTVRGAIDRRSQWATVTAERILSRDAWPTAGHLPALGATRRLRALAAIGWSLTPLSKRTGIHIMTLSHVRAGKGERIVAATHARIRDAYEQLCMTLGPSAQGRRAAEADGWPPPLAWDDIDDPDETPGHDGGDADDSRIDEAAVARVVAGKPATLTQAERREAVRRLARESVSDAAIARLVGCSTSTIFYDRQTLGIESRWVA